MVRWQLGWKVNISKYSRRQNGQDEEKVEMFFLEGSWYNIYLEMSLKEG